MAQTPADPSRRWFLEMGSAAALTLTLPGSKASAQATGNRTVAPPPSLAGVRGYLAADRNR